MSLREAYRIVEKLNYGYCLGGIEFAESYGFSFLEIQGVLVFVDKSTGAVSLKSYKDFPKVEISDFDREDIGLE